MPSGSTRVRHHRQSEPGACLPACVGMVLETLGEVRPESEWAQTLGSYSYGTPAHRVARLNALGYQVTYQRFSLDELAQQIAQDLYPIVFVGADWLPWVDFGGFHALVLIAVTAAEVALLDPALDHGPTRLSRDEFLIAWEEFDCLAAVITR